MSTNNEVKVTLELSGGLELLFNKQKKFQLTLSPSLLSPPSTSSTITLHQFIHYCKDNLVTERVELFIQDDSVRPGILVLINDCDWELLDGPEYILKEGDVIVFISTLHGG